MLFWVIAGLRANPISDRSGEDLLDHRAVHVGEAEGADQELVESYAGSRPSLRPWWSGFSAKRDEQSHFFLAHKSICCR